MGVARNFSRVSKYGGRTEALLGASFDSSAICSKHDFPPWSNEARGKSRGSSGVGASGTDLSTRRQQQRRRQYSHNPQKLPSHPSPPPKSPPASLLCPPPHYHFQPSPMGRRGGNLWRRQNTADGTSNKSAWPILLIFPAPHPVHPLPGRPQRLATKCSQHRPTSYRQARSGDCTAP